MVLVSRRHIRAQRHGYSIAGQTGTAWRRMCRLRTCSGHIAATEADDQCTVPSGTAVRHWCQWQRTAVAHTPSAVQIVGPPDVEVYVAADGGCQYIRAVDYFVGSAQAEQLVCKFPRCMRCEWIGISMFLHITKNSDSRCCATLASVSTVLHPSTHAHVLHKLCYCRRTVGWD